MRILSRYFALRYLGFFVAVLSVSVLSIAIVEMMLNLDRMLQPGDGARGVAAYMWLRLPTYYARDLLPVAGFGAAFLTLALSSRSREIMAMKAGGVTPMRAVVPIACVALALAGATLAANETIVLDADRSWQKLTERSDEATEMRRGSFWYHRGRTIYKLSSADREARTLRDVMMLERDGKGRLVRTVHARRALIEPGRVWRLENTVVRHFDPDRPEAPPSVEHLPVHRLRLDDAETALTDADPTVLDLASLRRAIATRRERGESTRRLETLYHGRLADPASVWLLSMLAVPLGLGVRDTRGLGRAALLGAVALGGFFLFRNVGRTLGLEGVAPAAVGTWLGPALFAAWATVRLARIPR